jgi:hypothetical protein
LEPEAAEKVKNKGDIELAGGTFPACRKASIARSQRPDDFRRPMALRC